MEGLGDYLCSSSRTGPWCAVFASGYVNAATQYARTQDLAAGDVVYVARPKAIRELFSASQLSQYLCDQLGLVPTRELMQIASGLAEDANWRVYRFVRENIETVGQIEQVKAITLTSAMVSPFRALGHALSSTG